MLQPLKTQLRRGAVFQLSVQTLTARMEATLMSRSRILFAGRSKELPYITGSLTRSGTRRTIVASPSPKGAKMKLAAFAKQHAAAEHNRGPSGRRIPRSEKTLEALGTVSF